MTRKATLRQPMHTHPHLVQSDSSRRTPIHIGPTVAAIDAQPSHTHPNRFTPNHTPSIARVEGRSRPRCMRNHVVQARGHGPMDTCVLWTSWNRYPRLFEPGSVQMRWFLTVFWVLNAPRSGPITQPRIEFQLAAPIRI